MIHDLVPLALALAVVVAVPGPNAVHVVTTAARDRRGGMLAALGVSAGDLVWALAALLGLGAALASARPVFVALKWVGAAYLVVFAVRLALGRGGGHDTSSGEPPAHPFRRGLLIDLANPKAAVFFTSLFVSLLPPDLSPGYGLVVFTVVAAIDVGWYQLVAAVLSRPAAQRAYRRGAKAVDRAAAGVVGALGVRLALSE
jgi:threonine/homoserine/homoserine lactone efflux protein